MSIPIDIINRNLDNINDIFKICTEFKKYCLFDLSSNTCVFLCAKIRNEISLVFCGVNLQFLEFIRGKTPFFVPLKFDINFNIKVQKGLD